MLTMYDVYPVNAPADYVPFTSFSLDDAEHFKHKIEQHYRNRFSMTLDWDETDPDKHISVSFTYAPSYLFDFTFAKAA